MQAAGEALNELGVDQSLPIDPFPLFGELGLKLVFQPLEGLLGAILDPTAELAQPGVLISTSRGPGSQRYTAAHELGHWFLHRDQLAGNPAADGIAEIYGVGSTVPREREAQIFAAYFLMPLPLVGSVAGRYGVRRNSEVTPVQMYSIARDLHVSYEAATRQLENLSFIDRGVRDDLLRVPPSRIKRELGRDRAPTNTAADVWLVSQPGERSVSAFVGDDVVLCLAENPSTGHRWMSRGSYDEAVQATAETTAPPAFGNGVALRFATAESIEAPRLGEAGELLRPVADRFVRSETASDLVGNGGERVVTLVAERRGVWKVELIYASPFDPAPPVAEMALEIEILNGPQQWAKNSRIAAVIGENG